MIKNLRISSVAVLWLIVSVSVNITSCSSPEDTQQVLEKKIVEIAIYHVGENHYSLHEWASVQPSLRNHYDYTLYDRQQFKTRFDTLLPTCKPALESFEYCKITFSDYEVYWGFLGTSAPELLIEQISAEDTIVKALCIVRPYIEIFE